MVKIITDTLSDIPSQLAQELGVTVVPLNVHFGNDIYRDGVDLSTDEFYQKLTTGEAFPITSAPVPGVFIETFTKLAEETDEILAIMPSHKFGAMYESALRAKAMMKTGCHIEVIDSLLAVGGEMLVVIKAAKAARAGANLEQISDMVKKTIPRIHTRMVFDTLEYLRQGGRIGKAQAFLGSLLKVNAILGVKNGEVVPIARARNRARAIDFLVNFVKGFPKIESLVIEHATTPDELEILAERLREIFPKEQMYRSKVGAVVGAHVGPHVLAVSVLEGEIT